MDILLMLLIAMLNLHWPIFPTIWKDDIVWNKKILKKTKKDEETTID